MVSGNTIQKRHEVTRQAFGWPKKTLKKANQMGAGYCLAEQRQSFHTLILCDSCHIFVIMSLSLQFGTKKW